MNPIRITPSKITFNLNSINNFIPTNALNSFNSLIFKLLPYSRWFPTGTGSYRAASAFFKIFIPKIY